MSLQHAAIEAQYLHENKGVDSASDDYVATVTNGATIWKKLTADNLTGTGNPFGGQLLHIQDIKPSGTNGGSFSSLTWRTRDLNTVITNEIDGASLGASNNRITLPTGTYFAYATAPACGVDEHKARLQNLGTGTTALHGTCAFAQKIDSNFNVTGGSSGGQVHVTADTSGADSVVAGRFIVDASTRTFELQHYCTANGSSTGFGRCIAIAGISEIYSQIFIWKIA